MKIILAGFIAAVLAFILVGPVVSFITIDKGSGFFAAVIAALAAGYMAATAVKKIEQQRLKEQANFKRVYHYDMETVFKKMQLRMELAIQGPKFWTPKIVEMSDGWMVYTYAVKKELLTLQADTLSLMVAKASDVTESLEEPKTQVIIHFWTNYQLLMPQELIKQANWLVDGFDASLPKHEKLTMNPEDMIQLKTMLPDPAA